MSSDLPDDQLPPQPSTKAVDAVVPPSPESVKMPMPPLPPPVMPSAPTVDAATPPPVASFALLDSDEPPTPPTMPTPLLPADATDLTPPQPLPQKMPIDEVKKPDEKMQLVSTTDEQPVKTPVIAPPTKDEIAPEESFPGQPIPESQQKDLEKQAEKLIVETGGKLTNHKPPSKIMQTALGVLALMLVSAGAYFGQKLVSTTGVGDIRQQAFDHLPPAVNGSCGSGYYECVKGCCGIGGTPTEGYSYSLADGTEFPKGMSVYALLDSPTYHDAIVAQLQSQGLAFDSGQNTLVVALNTSTLDYLKDNPVIYNWCFNADGTMNSSHCAIVAGGYLYVGGLRAGDSCNPIVGPGGADWCQLVAESGNITYTGSCGDVGLIRCICNNGVGVIGSNNGTCDNLCGGTDNICESCDEPPGTNPPETPPPSQPPGETLACSGMTSVPALPKLGDSVRYSCTGTSSPQAINHFDFQYKIGAAGFVSLAEDPVGSGQSLPLVIADPGSYVVRCRACKSADGANCSAWQNL